MLTENVSLWDLPQPPQPPPRKHIPAPFMERLVLGVLAGLTAQFWVGAIYLCVRRHDLDDSVGMALCFMTPLLMCAGATCAVVSWYHGWGRVRPVVWSILGGFLGNISLGGWVLGGMAGGFLSGLLRRSVRSMTKGALVGALLGLILWLLVWGYFFGLAALFSR